ncbi:SprT-like domain-containing protein [Bacillus pumilus]|uniref:SprT-like domain-containing protein n=1 Tax=Bacillus pumilus TaxID=1408 RepID=UPI0037046005
MADVTAELHKAFLIFNKTFFEDCLPVPAITIQSNIHNRNSMGWCSVKPAWSSTDGKQKMYELNISAEYADYDFLETMDTLLHEMVHLYHGVKGIKDTSRKGEYHNTKFRDKVLELGFEYKTEKPDPRHGWSFARIGPKLREQIAQMDIDQEVFVIAKRNTNYMAAIESGETPPSDDPGATEPTKAKPKSHRWECPCCEVRIVSYREEVNIRCMDCDEEFIKVTGRKKRAEN